MKVFGPQRVGLKVGPLNEFNDMHDTDPEKLMDCLLEGLNERNIAFVECDETFSPQSADRELNRRT